MPNTNVSGATQVNFTLTNDVETSVDATVIATITSPSGVESSVVFQVTLN
jgi:hypothetical protein